MAGVTANCKECGFMIFDEQTRLKLCDDCAKLAPEDRLSARRAREAEKADHSEPRRLLNGNVELWKAGSARRLILRSAIAEEQRSALPLSISWEEAARRIVERESQRSNRPIQQPRATAPLVDEHERLMQEIATLQKVLADRRQHLLHEQMAAEVERLKHEKAKLEAEVKSDPGAQSFLRKFNNLDVESEL